MKITEIYFLLFLPVVVLFYYLVSARLRWAVLVLGSLFFLAADSWTALVVLATTILFNFFGAQKLETSQDGHKGWWLWAMVLGNVGILALFKYYNGINRAGSLYEQLTGSEWPFPHVEWLLPLGISYYIFQAIGHHADAYTGKTTASVKFSQYAVFLSFFPKITAGPIERYQGFVEQLQAPLQLRYDNIRDGGRLLLWGFFKKLFLSSYLHAAITPVLDSDSTAGVPLLLALFFYTVEVYMDVSGYTDIALGTARLFGIRLTENFNRPYAATSITDFWRRWHISLSSWVNDYIFKPLSLWLSLRWGLGRWAIYAALLLSFFVIGIWHGSDWNFVAFGLLHGAVLTFEVATVAWRQKRAEVLPKWLLKPLSLGYVQLIFLYSCLFFRATTLEQAYDWISRSAPFVNGTLDLPNTFDAMGWLTLLGVSVFLTFDQAFLRERFEVWCGKLPLVLRWMLYAGLAYAIIAGSKVVLEPFIYRGF